MNKINYSRLEKVLSEKEMKNILGGSIHCLCACDGYSFVAVCTGSHEECMSWYCGGCGHPLSCSYN